MNIFKRLRSLFFPAQQGHYHSITSASDVNSWGQGDLTFPVVRTCFNNIATDVSGAALVVYRKREDGGRDTYNKHPIFKLMNRSPNAIMSARSFRYAMTMAVLLHGNAYAIINRSRDGTVASLAQVPSQGVQIKVTSDGLLYMVSTPKGRLQIPGENMLHLLQETQDGIHGTSVLSRVGITVKIGSTAESFALHSLKNHSTPSGILKVPKAHGAELEARRANVEKQFIEKLRGSGNSNKIGVLDKNIDFVPIKSSMEELQLIDIRRHQRHEFAAAMRMPLHILQELERATYSNVEHLSREYVKFCIGPWTKVWDSVINMRLLSEAEQDQGVYATHDLSDMQRGDTETRAKAITMMLLAGMISLDEARGLEGQNPVGNEDGKKFYVPINMVERVSTPQRGPQSLLPKQEEARAARYASDEPQEETEEAVEAEVRAGFHAIKEAQEGSTTPATRETQKERIVLQGRRALSAAWKEKILDALNAGRKKITAAARSQFSERDSEAFVYWLQESLPKMQNEVKRELERTMNAYLLNVVDTSVEEFGGALNQAQRAGLETFIDAYINGAAHRQIAIVSEKLQKQADEKRIDELESVSTGEQTGETTRARNAVARAAYLAMGVTKLQSVSYGDSCPYCEQLNGKVIGITEVFAGPGDSIPSAQGLQRLPINRATHHPPYHKGCDCEVVYTL